MKSLEDRTREIADYLKRYDIQVAILGISGGVDSAVVLGILDKVKRDHVPDLEIYPVSLPFFLENGVTGQREASETAKQVVHTFGYDFIERPLDANLEPFLQEGLTPWAKGQIASIVRYVALASIAISFQDSGKKSLVFGTINRTEYEMGYWGKWSDALPDYQPIIDIYKSKVYEIAKMFKLDFLLDRAPTGDVYDGRTDEDIMGSSYDEIEKFLYDGDRSAVSHKTLEFYESNLWKKMIGIPGIM